MEDSKERKDIYATEPEKDAFEPLVEEADLHFSFYEIPEAIARYKQALKMLESKKDSDEEKIAEILTSLGDCYFIEQNMKEALGYYLKAFQLPNGVGNAYALLRTGQVYYEQNNLERAGYYLFQAYLIEGESLFEDEDKKYLDLIRTSILSYEETDFSSTRNDEPRNGKIREAAKNDKEPSEDPLK